MSAVRTSAVPRAWREIAPGVYGDDAGVLHLVVPELLAATGYDDSPQHREILLEAVHQVFRGADVTISEED